MIVVRKFFASVIWFIIFLVLILGVFIAYTFFQIDLTNETAATAEAERMGQEFGEKYGLPMISASAGLAIIGSIFGILPGSRHAPRENGQTTIVGLILRKTLGFVLYFLVFYFGSLLVGGAIVGGMAGAEASNMATAQEAGRIAGEEFSQKYGNYILIGALAVSGLGSLFGWLPFTRHRKPAH